MVQLNYCLQLIILNAIGLCNAIGFSIPQFNNQRLYHKSGIFGSSNLGSIPAATSCHEIDCGPSHVCQVVREGFCLPLLPCPKSIATCIPKATPRIGVSTPRIPLVDSLRIQVSTPRLPPATKRFGEGLKKTDTTLKIQISKIPNTLKSTNLLRKKIQPNKRKEDTSHQNRGEYKGMVKGLSTPKLPQFPFLDKAQKTLMSGFYNSFYPHSSKRSSPFKATKAPLVFITQRDIEKRLKETNNREENHIFSLLHGLRHVKPFFRLKGPGMDGFTRRVDKVEFKTSDRLENTPAPFAPSQPYPYQKIKYEKVKRVQRPESNKIKAEVKIDAEDSNYQTLMNVLNEKRKKNATKIIIDHNGFQPKNKAEFEFNMRTMREHLEKVKAKEIFEPVLTKMLDMNAVKKQSKIDPNPVKLSKDTTIITKQADLSEDATMNTNQAELSKYATNIKKQAQVDMELTTAVQDIPIETTTESIVEYKSEDNEIVDISDWLEISKITPKRRKIDSRSKEKVFTAEEENALHEIDQIIRQTYSPFPQRQRNIISRRIGLMPEQEQEQTVTENYGSKVKETYKMDFNRPIVKKHVISLDEFDQMDFERPIIKEHVISLDDFQDIKDSVSQ